MRTTRSALALAALLTVALASSASAAPTSDASFTLATHAGTTCTFEVDYEVGGALLARPIAYETTILCTPADAGGVITVLGGNMLLEGSLPLNLGSSGSSQKTQNRPPPAHELPPECDASPGVDCGSTGFATLLPTATYTLISGVAIPAPEGEAWEPVPAGCEVTDGFALCAYESAPITA